jgi:hypothetical protein
MVAEDRLDALDLRGQLRAFLPRARSHCFARIAGAFRHLVGLMQGPRAGRTGPHVPAATGARAGVPAGRGAALASSRQALGRHVGSGPDSAQRGALALVAPRGIVA